VRTSETPQFTARNFELVKETPSSIPDLWESAHSERSTQMNIILTTIEDDDENIIRSDN